MARKGKLIHDCTVKMKMIGRAKYKNSIVYILSFHCNSISVTIIFILWLIYIVREVQPDLAAFMHVEYTIRVTMA